MVFKLFKACFVGSVASQTPSSPAASLASGSPTAIADTPHPAPASGSGESSMGLMPRDIVAQRRQAHLRAQLRTHARAEVSGQVKLVQAASLCGQGRFALAKKIYEEVLLAYPAGSPPYERALQGLEVLAQRLRLVTRNSSPKLAQRAQDQSDQIRQQLALLRSAAR